MQIRCRRFPVTVRVGPRCYGERRATWATAVLNSDDWLTTDVVDDLCERGRLIARRSDVFGLASVRRMPLLLSASTPASLNLTH